MNKENLFVDTARWHCEAAPATVQLHGAHSSTGSLLCALGCTSTEQFHAALANYVKHLEATCGAYTQPLLLLGHYANKFNSLQNSCYCSNEERGKIKPTPVGLKLHIFKCVGTRIWAWLYIYSANIHCIMRCTITLWR